MKEDEIGGTFSAHEIINVSKILVGKPKGKITLEDNIKICISVIDMDSVDWINPNP